MRLKFLLLIALVTLPSEASYASCGERAKLFGWLDENTFSTNDALSEMVASLSSDQSHLEYSLDTREGLFYDGKYLDAVHHIGEGVIGLFGGAAKRSARETNARIAARSRDRDAAYKFEEGLRKKGYYIVRRKGRWPYDEYFDEYSSSLYSGSRIDDGPWTEPFLDAYAGVTSWEKDSNGNTKNENVFYTFRPTHQVPLKELRGTTELIIQSELDTGGFLAFQYLDRVYTYKNLQAAVTEKFGPPIATSLARFERRPLPLYLRNPESDPKLPDTPMHYAFKIDKNYYVAEVYLLRYLEGLKFMDLDISKFISVVAFSIMEYTELFEKAKADFQLCLSNEAESARANEAKPKL